MNYDEPPFKYDIPIKRIKITDTGEVIVNPETNRAFFISIETLEFPSNLNGIKTHHISGSIRECFAKFLFKSSYIEILNNPTKNAKFHKLLKIYLREIVIHYNEFYQPFKGLYVTSNNGEVFEVREDLKKINSFIDSIIALETDYQSIELKGKIPIKNTNYQSQKNITIKLEMEGFEVREKLQNQIFSYVQNWLENSNENNRSNLTNFCIKYLIQQNVPSLPNKEYLENLKSYIELLLPSVRDEASVKRLLKGMINNSNSLLTKMYFYVNKTHQKSVRNTKHLVILHTLSALGILSEFETIYKQLYIINCSKSILNSAVTDYIKNKIKK